MQNSILVIDDDAHICQLLQLTFDKEGYEVFIAHSAEESLLIVEKEDLNLIFLDIRLPEMDGMEALKIIKERFPNIEVIMITGYGEVKTAIDAMKFGAYDYVSKPFDLEEIRVLADKAIESARLKAEVDFLKVEESRRYFQDLIGESPQMKEVFLLIKKVSRSPTATVLIHGKNGTGKETVARAIHSESDRREFPFIAVNCSAHPQNKLEAELFGYEKDAFPDAVTRKKGYFELARGGTILLNEIGDMSLNLQAKLLRVIQENQITRIGGIRNIGVDIRIIAAMSKSLERAVRNMEFREDLYFRLNVVTVELPPLRHRDNDVILLMHYFIKEGNRQFNKNIRVISKDVIDIFHNYSWLGNVRELKNIIERIMILNDGEILQPDYLPREFLHKHQDGDVKILQTRHEGESFRSLRKRTIEEFEMNFVKALLKKNKGDIVQSSVEAKLGITEFKKLVKKYYIAPLDYDKFS